MPDDNPKPPSSPAVPTSTPTPEPQSTKPPGLDLGPGVGVNVTQDMATAERKLPPAKVVLIVLGALLVILALYGFLGRAKPQGMGSIDNVAAVEIPNQNAMLVAIKVS